MFNLVIVLILTFIVSGILIFFISAHDRKRQIQKEATTPDSEKNQNPTYDFKQFGELCVKIAQNLNLEIEDIKHVDDSELNIKAIDKNPITQVQFIIVAIYQSPQDRVDASKIMEISDHIISERISKAIIMTPGQIDMSVLSRPELAPMIFMDGTKLKELALKYDIEY